MSVPSLEISQEHLFPGNHVLDKRETGNLDEKSKTEVSEESLFSKKIRVLDGNDATIGETSSNVLMMSSEQVSESPGPQEGATPASVDLEEENQTSESGGCPNVDIGIKNDLETTNTTCITHELSESDCRKANEFYRIDQEALKCLKPQQILCSFEETSRAAITDKLIVKCDSSPCGGNALHVIPMDHNTGILKDHEKWHKFISDDDLEEFLPDFIVATSAQGFNFCFLACLSKDRKDYVEQILYFPPTMAKNREKQSKRKDFNVNILVLDSVSRPHFYRSLPETVDSLRKLGRGDTAGKTTVFDFKLFQSSAAQTFENIQELMSGKNNSVMRENHTYGIEILFGKFRRQQYYTLLQEDSCWFDTWGSLFTDNIHQGKKPANKLEYYLRWQSFQEKVRGFFVDDYGLSLTPCEVFRRYNTTNQFNQPKRVCFGGRVFAEYFLDYVESVFIASRASADSRPVFSYTHLNIGHEVTGRRIRQLDGYLAAFVGNMAKYNDTLTIILSDHGPKTTKYAFHSLEGRKEAYNPFFFMVIPEDVADVLGNERMRALRINQDRLLSTLDLHEALMSIGDASDTSQRGVFEIISANRTCDDLNLTSGAICKCEGWEKRLSSTDEDLLWIAELGLGTLNNKIQEQHLKEGPNLAGFGKCQRLVGKEIAKVRRRTPGNDHVTTMDLVVNPGREIFEIQVQHPKAVSGIGMAAVSFTRRITIYRHFSKCADQNVSISLCVCRLDRNKPDGNATWINIRSRKDVLRVLASAKSFHADSKIKNVHGKCLFLVTRKHGTKGRTKVVEVSNACGGRWYNIRVWTERTKNAIVSRELPFSMVLMPKTIHFLFTVHHLREPYDTKVLVSYEYHRM